MIRLPQTQTKTQTLSQTRTLPNNFSLNLPWMELTLGLMAFAMLSR
jgi:hypothetical protein